MDGVFSKELGSALNIKDDFDYTGCGATVMCFCFIFYVKQNCLSFNALRSISICRLLRFNASSAMKSFSSFIFILHACIYIAYSG